jgi:hypothetical protein
MTTDFYLQSIIICAHARSCGRVKINKQTIKNLKFLNLKNDESMVEHTLALVWRYIDWISADAQCQIKFHSLTPQIGCEIIFRAIKCAWIKKSVWRHLGLLLLEKGLLNVTSEGPKKDRWKDKRILSIAIEGFKIGQIMKTSHNRLFFSSIFSTFIETSTNVQQQQ